MNLMLVALLFALPAFAQIDENNRTGGLVNCRFWNSGSEDERLFFVVGFSHALVWSQVKTGVASGTLGEIARGVTAICEAPENARLWIAVAFEAFRRKQIGTSRDNVDAFLARERQLAAQVEQ